MSDVDPHLKLFVKEESDKVAEKLRTEISQLRDEIKKANTRGWRFVGAIGTVLGLLTAVGVYGFAVSHSKNFLTKSIEDLGLKSLKEYESEATEIMANLRGRDLAVAGTAASGSEISPPDGTIEDWAVLVAPYQAARPIEPRGENESDNSVIGIAVSVEPAKDKKSWEISGHVKHRIGNGGSNHIKTAQMKQIGYVLVRRSVPDTN